MDLSYLVSAFPGKDMVLELNLIHQYEDKLQALFIRTDKRFRYAGFGGDPVCAAAQNGCSYIHSALGTYTGHTPYPN